MKLLMTGMLLVLKLMTNGRSTNNQEEEHTVKLLKDMLLLTYISLTVPILIVATLLSWCFLQAAQVIWNLDTWLGPEKPHTSCSILIMTGGTSCTNFPMTSFFRVKNF